MPLATVALATGEGHAAHAVPPGAGAAVELSPLGRVAALLGAFGDPVLELAEPQESGTPALPGETHPATPDAAPRLEKALADTLSPHLAGAPAHDAPAEASTPLASSLPSAPAVPEEAAAAQPAPTAQSAGALLNALLSAALTGQAALELRRPDQPPLRLELEREPDGHGAFRVSRVRIRHETADGVLEAAVQLGSAAHERAPLGVDIAASGALSEAVAQRLDELRDALGARGLSAAVRARPAAAAPSPPLLPMSGD